MGVYVMVIHTMAHVRNHEASYGVMCLLQGRIRARDVAPFSGMVPVFTASAVYLSVPTSLPMAGWHVLGPKFPLAAFSVFWRLKTVVIEVGK